MRIMFLGDTHGNYNWMKKRVLPVATENGVDLILQLGDWGFMWPGDDKWGYLHATLESAEIPMWFIDGNHDDHPRLREFAKREDGGFGPYLKYLTRGSRFELDGVTFLALGGAYSVDKDWRTPGLSWWPEEEIATHEAYVATENGNAMVMLTHDMPWNVKLAWDRKADFPRAAPNRQLLQRVIEEVRPKWVFHGHLHFRQTSLMALAGGHMVRVESLNCDEPYDQRGHRSPDSDAWMIKDTEDLVSITRDLDESRVVRAN